MKLNLILVVVLGLFSSIAFSQMSFTDTITHDSLERAYILTIPSSYNPSTKIPLVFNLHGATSNAGQQQLYSVMDAVAESEGFLVCYPRGEGGFWNVGWNFGSTLDDVGFIDKLIDRISSNYTVDADRIYSCGMSNGGFMSYRLACELNDKIAAVASVTGSIVPSYLPNCNPGKAVPVMQIHGTADSTVPYIGTIGVSTHIDSLIEYWVNNNGCSNLGDTTVFPDINMNDASTAFRVDYNMCNENSKVSLIVIVGGAHTWPGATLIIDVTNKDVHASQEIWEFFKQFSLSGSVGLDDIEESNIEVFPNPASGLLRINSDIMFESYRIYDVNGRLIMNGKFRETIDVSDLMAGTYVLLTENGEELSRKMFVIK